MKLSNLVIRCHDETSINILKMLSLSFLSVCIPASNETKNWFSVKSFHSIEQKLLEHSAAKDQSIIKIWNLFKQV